MNGAAPVPPRTTRTPRKRTTTTIGVSHHFLFPRRNSQNSTRNPACLASASRAKSDGPRVGLSSLDSMVLRLLLQNCRKYRAVFLVGRRSTQYDDTPLSNRLRIGSRTTNRIARLTGVATRKYTAVRAT